MHGMQGPSSATQSITQPADLTRITQPADLTRTVQKGLSINPKMPDEQGRILLSNTYAPDAVMVIME